MRFFRDGPTSNRIPPSSERLILTDGWQALVDPTDLEELKKHKWTSNNKGYVIRTTSGEPRELHRILTGATRGQLVDHANGNALDNRRCNLRLCTNAQNVQNMAKSVGKSSKYKGVSWHKGNRRWLALIQVDGKKRILGYFRREQEAAIAYDKAAVEAWGEFARPNFPREPQCIGSAN